MNKPSARRTVAENLRIIRLLRNLSQEALADLVGVDRTYIGGIERAERNLSIDNLEKIARGLGVSILDLLREPDPYQLADKILEAVRNAVDGAPLRIRDGGAEHAYGCFAVRHPGGRGEPERPSFTRSHPRP